MLAPYEPPRSLNLTKVKQGILINVTIIPRFDVGKNTPRWPIRKMKFCNAFRDVTDDHCTRLTWF